ASPPLHRIDRGGLVPSAGGGGPACPTLPLPRVAGRRPHTCAMTTERSSRTTWGVGRRPDRSAAGPTRATSWSDRGDAETTRRQNPRWSHLRRPPWAADPGRGQDLAGTQAAGWLTRGRQVSGGDSHGRIGLQGGREKWAITTSRKSMYERP